MSVTYARLGASPEDTNPHRPAYHNHHTSRTLLLALLFLLSFIFVFVFTISLSLLLGDVHHERSGVLVLESQTSFNELEENSEFYGEDEAPEGATDGLEVESWRQIEARLPKIDRQALDRRQLRFDDRLLNLRNFSYHLTADRSLRQCLAASKTASSLNLVILIHSAVEHLAHRQQLRRSWLQVNTSLVAPAVTVAHAFILGQTTSAELQAAVQMEHQLYGDIVQGTFADSYRNLTYKHLAGLRWAVQFDCATHADYLLKVDDDAFVESYAVLEYLVKRKANRRPTAPIACSLFPEGTAPKRSGKWALSYSAYPFESFPSYCSGVGYFATAELAADLVAAASQLPPELPIVPIDDVFITGLLRATLTPTVKATPINGRYVYDARKLRRWLRTEGDCPSGYLIGDIGNEEDRISLAAKLWSKTEQAWRRREKCPKRRRNVYKVSSL